MAKTSSRKPPSKPPKAAASSGQASRQASFEEPDLEVTTGVIEKPLKVMIYGSGGVGKTTLASTLSNFIGSLVFVDIEESSDFVEASRVHPENWSETRGYLRGKKILDFDGVVIDSLTRSVNYCESHVIETIPHEKDRPIKRLDDYGWGKGVHHLHDEFLPILSDLDRLVHKGKHVICVAHDCTSTVPNPNAEDFIRYEPRLPSGTKKGEANIRAQVFEWADHVFFIDMDQEVKDGKAKSSNNTRSIYPYKTPTFWAKSRSLDEIVDFPDPSADPEGAAEIWRLLLNK